MIYLSVFDNGDARGMEQPPAADHEVFSRCGLQDRPEEDDGRADLGSRQGSWLRLLLAGYRNHEVHGRQGHDACLLVNGRMGASPEKAGKLGRLHPRICEYRWGDKSLAVDLTLWDTCGYQAFPVSFEEAFSKN